VNGSLPLAIGAVLLASGVLLFLVLPIFRGQSASLERFEGELTDAEARKRAALRALRDVDYDFHTGKLDDKDYRELKNVLAHDALVAMGRVEAESGAGTATVATVADDELEAEIARAREGLRSGSICGACGHPNTDDSRFCAMCGGALAGERPVEESPAS